MISPNYERDASWIKSISYLIKSIILIIGLDDPYHDWVYCLFWFLKEIISHQLNVPKVFSRQCDKDKATILINWSGKCKAHKNFKKKSVFKEIRVWPFFVSTICIFDQSFVNWFDGSIRNNKWLVKRTAKKNITP